MHSPPPFPHCPATRPPSGHSSEERRSLLWALAGTVPIEGRPGAAGSPCKGCSSAWQMQAMPAIEGNAAQQGVPPPSPACVPLNGHGAPRRIAPASPAACGACSLDQCRLSCAEAGTGGPELLQPCPARPHARYQRWAFCRYNFLSLPCQPGWPVLQSVTATRIRSADVMKRTQYGLTQQHSTLEEGLGQRRSNMQHSAAAQRQPRRHAHLRLILRHRQPLLLLPAGYHPLPWGSRLAGRAVLHPA